jgi:glutamine amidotransferase
LHRFRPLGQTDSEHVFCHLLDAIASHLGDLQTEKSWSWLHAKLLSMNRHGRMNFLLSDGRSLFCYHDLAGHKGLTWRPLPGHTPQPSRLEDRDLKIELDAAPATRGMVVATCPLSGTGWKTVRPGELLVVQDGKLAFSQQQSRQSVY